MPIRVSSSRRVLDVVTANDAEAVQRFDVVSQ
jgi:hypothetical protein